MRCAVPVCGTLRQFLSHVTNRAADKAMKKRERFTTDLRQMTEPEKRTHRLRLAREAHARRMEIPAYRLARLIQLALAYNSRCEKKRG